MKKEKLEMEKVIPKIAEKFLKDEIYFSAEYDSIQNTHFLIYGDYGKVFRNELDMFDVENLLYEIKIYFKERINFLENELEVLNGTKN